MGDKPLTMAMLAAAIESVQLPGFRVAELRVTPAQWHALTENEELRRYRVVHVGSLPGFDFHTPNGPVRVCPEAVPYA